jgi:hypothetical protein
MVGHSKKCTRGEIKEALPNMNNILFYVDVSPLMLEQGSRGCRAGPRLQEHRPT